MKLRDHLFFNNPSADGYSNLASCILDLDRIRTGRSKAIFFVAQLLKIHLNAPDTPGQKTFYTAINAMTRFDILRPLYNGRYDYCSEILRLTYFPIAILPAFWLRMGSRLLAAITGGRMCVVGNEIAVQNPIRVFTLTLLTTVVGTPCFALLAAYSIVTALVSLITRPILNYILGASQ